MLKTLAGQAPLLLVIGVGLGWSIRELRAMHCELKRVTGIAGEARDGLRELKIRIEEKVEAADREHEDLRERIVYLERSARTRPQGA